MGQNAYHPIRQRLTEALRAALPAPARNDGSSPLPDNLPDDEALRDWVLRHHARYGLDPVWILTGYGGKPENDGPSDTRLAPVFAMSPIDSRSGRWRPMTVERITLPADVVTPLRFVIRMEDRALEPRIRQGAYLVVDTTQTRITAPPTRQPTSTAEAPVFAVDVPGEGLLARLANHDPQTDRLVLTALDPYHPPLLMPWSTAGDRVVGRVVWVAQTL